MHINEIPFYDCVMRYTFWDSRTDKNEKAVTIATSIKKFAQAYKGCGYNVRHILGDGKFEQIRKAINGTRMNLNGN